VLVKVDLAGFRRLPGRITEVPKPFRAVRKTPIQIAGSILTHIPVGSWEWHLDTGEVHRFNELYRIFGFG
jgi:hypothetical protein